MSKYLPYLYLGRFPLLTALLLVALAPLSLFSGLESLLRGLFDLKPWGLFFVAMGSLLGAWTGVSRVLLNLDDFLTRE